METSKKISLEPSASLIMQWGRNIYSNPIVQKYHDHLDLEHVDLLENKITNVCNWHKDVVLDSKYYLTKCIEKEFSEVNQKHLIIIVGAGQSPFALKLLSEYDKNVAEIIEIDSKLMKLKKELYDTHFHEFTEKIECLNVDLNSDKMLATINHLIHDFYKDIPTIVILEGTSYKFTKSDFANIVNNLKSENHNVTVLFDYLVSEETLCAKYKSVQSELYQVIEEFSDLDSINTLTEIELKSLFDAAGGRLIEVVNSNKMEIKRNGVNKIFDEQSNGWIELAYCKI